MPRGAMAQIQGPSSEQAPTDATPESAGDRRISGRRARGRDRLMDRANQDYTPNPALAQVRDVENLLLFIDDDLRETALAMERIEKYLLSTLGVLDGESLDRQELHSLATDSSVIDQVELLNETLESLRRRMARLARMV
ncbi:hypothetical protein ACNOYE_12980 [Nannocystaceae bacterium ST9]